MLESHLFLKGSLLIELDDLHVVGILCQEGCDAHAEGIKRMVGECDSEDIPGGFVGDDLVLTPSFLLHGSFSYRHLYAGKINVYMIKRF